MGIRFLAVAEKTIEARDVWLCQLELGLGPVERQGRANECLQRLFIDLLAHVKVGGTPCVPIKIGIEETRWIL